MDSPSPFSATKPLPTWDRLSTTSSCASSVISGSSCYDGPAMNQEFLEYFWKEFSLALRLIYFDLRLGDCVEIPYFGRFVKPLDYPFRLPEFDWNSSWKTRFPQFVHHVNSESGDIRKCHSFDFFRLLGLMRPELRRREDSLSSLAPRDCRLCLKAVLRQFTRALRNRKKDRLKLIFREFATFIFEKTRLVIEYSKDLVEERVPSMADSTAAKSEFWSPSRYELEIGDGDVSVSSEVGKNPAGFGFHRRSFLKWQDRSALRREREKARAVQKANLELSRFRQIRVREREMPGITVRGEEVSLYSRSEGSPPLVVKSEDRFLDTFSRPRRVRERSGGRHAPFRSRFLSRESYRNQLLEQIEERRQSEIRRRQAEVSQEAEITRAQAERHAERDSGEKRRVAELRRRLRNDLDGQIESRVRSRRQTPARKQSSEFLVALGISLAERGTGAGRNRKTTSTSSDSSGSGLFVLADEDDDLSDSSSSLSSRTSDSVSVPPTPPSESSPSDSSSPSPPRRRPASSSPRPARVGKNTHTHSSWKRVSSPMSTAGILTKKWNSKSARSEPALL